MIVDRRRVDRLSLRVSRPADAPRGVAAIREALRVASMPGDGHPGRLFIRRLDLGTIRLDAGLQPIVRELETYLRRLRVDAVPISDARAPHADVVIARDPVEPLVLALTHAAARRRLSAWYWPRVDERLTPGRTPSEIAAIVWTLLATRRDAVASVPAVVGVLLEAGEGAAEVLAAVDPIVGEQLTRALEVQAPPAELALALVQTIVPARWRPVVSEVIAKWGADRRAAWLVAAVVKAAYPRISIARFAGLVRGASAVSGQPSRPDRSPTQADVESPRAELPREAPEPGRAAISHRVEASALASMHAPPVTPAAFDPAAAFEPPTASEPATRVGSSEQTSTPSEPAQPFERPQPLEQPRAASTRWALIERPQPTRYGGLYFLLRPLARLGLAAFVTEHPELEELDLGVRTLDRIAAALGIAPDDPIRVALELPSPPPNHPVPEPPAFANLWTEAVPAPSLAGLDPLQDLIESWHAAVSAWLDRHAQLDLPTVVVRDAAVLCTRTHLDVIFDMEASDVRIRKAALDIDPGWVPWLGRVVQFHYVHGGLLDG